MLKLSFEAGSVAELKELIGSTLEELGEGATPAGVATPDKVKRTAKEKDKVKEITKAEVQEAFASSGLSRPEKLELLNELNVGSISELETSEYALFLEKLEIAKKNKA